MLSDAGAASRDRQKICPHQWFPAPDQWAEGFRQIPPMPSKDRSTYEAQEEPGGEGWLPVSSVATATGERSVKRK
jgi:ribosome modulation factor